MRTAFRFLLVAVPLALMGYGAWLIWPPCAPAVVGLALWIDIRRIWSSEP